MSPFWGKYYPESFFDIYSNLAGNMRQYGIPETMINFMKAVYEADKRYVDLHVCQLLDAFEIIIGV